MSRNLSSLLLSTPLFSALEDADRAALSEHLAPVYLSGGQVLMTEGSAADGLYILMSGRLQASVRQGDEVEVVVGEVSAGELVGEMALVSDAPRSATVTAVRDSTLLRLSKADFRLFVSQHPEAMFGVSRLLVDRLERANRSAGTEKPLMTIAVVPVSGDIDGEGFGEGLVASLQRYREAVLVGRRRVDGEFGPNAADAEPGSSEYARVGSWLHDFEAQRNVVVYLADPEPTLWSARCLRQADRVLYVGRPEDLLLLNPIEMEARANPRYRSSALVDLVVLHPASTVRPAGTARLLEDRHVDRHHHMREGSAADFDRVARVVTGRGIGVVFSGGGARGFAHVGVLKALIEAQIPIDMVGGASFGSSVAAAHGMGWSIDEILSEEKRVTVDVGSLIDFTFPAVSLARGERLTRGMRVGYGDVQIEDLWTDFFCVSSDLTAGRLRVHTDGPVWQAVRASVAIPGVFPPVRSPEGHVLVDGGIMNNLPVDVMRRLADGGRIIGVDLRARTDLPSSQLPGDGVLSGWAVTGKRVNPMSPRMDVPRMLDVMIRSTEMASGERTYDADLMLTPPVEEFGILDFKRYRDIVDVGYRHATEALERAAKEGLDLLG